MPTQMILRTFIFSCNASAMSDIYTEMEMLESEAGKGTLIPGLPLPPTNPATNNQIPPAPPTRHPQRRNGSAIVNPPRRIIQTNTPRRCLIHLAVRCPICFRTPHHRNPRFFRQEGIQAILTLIREVFGVNLNQEN